MRRSLSILQREVNARLPSEIRRSVIQAISAIESEPAICSFHFSDTLLSVDIGLDKTFRDCNLPDDYSWPCSYKEARRRLLKKYDIEQAIQAVEHSYGEDPECPDPARFIDYEMSNRFGSDWAEPVEIASPVELACSTRISAAGHSKTNRCDLVVAMDYLGWHRNAYGLTRTENAMRLLATLCVLETALEWHEGLEEAIENKRNRLREEAKRIEVETDALETFLNPPDRKDPEK